MVDTSGKDNEVVLSKISHECARQHVVNSTRVVPYLFYADANPFIICAPDVEVAMSVADVADLLVLVQVFMEERLDLLFVHVAHLLRGDDDLVPVLVSAVGSELVDAVEVGDPVVVDAELPQLVNGDLLARVVCQTLVAL